MISPDFFPILVGASVFAFAVLLWQQILLPWGAKRRLKELAKRREGLQKASTLSPHRRKPKPLGMSLMRRLTERLNLVGSDVAQQAAKRLSRAGWRSQDAVVIYLFARFTLPFIAGIGALIFGQMSAQEGDSLRDVLILTLPPVLIAAFLPELPIRQVTEKRQKAILNALPDGLDLLVVCAQAGLSLDAALDRVAREMDTGAPELADELRLTVMELGFLPDRKQALQNLISRTGINQVESVVNTLLQTERYGTPLAQSLRVLAAEYRNQRLLKAEEKAARLPAIMTVPMIVFILPVLFVVMLGPALLGVLDAFK